MIEQGKVIKVEGDVAYVQFKRTSACGNCQACGMLKDMSEVTVDVKNTGGAKTGDTAVIEFSFKHSLKSSLLAYGFPLLMLFIGVFFGYYILIGWFPGAEPDVVAALSGLGFTICAFLAMHLIEPRIKKKMANTFKMVSVTKNEEEPLHERKNSDPGEL